MWDSEAYIVNDKGRQNHYNSRMGKLFEKMGVHETAIEYYTKSSNKTLGNSQSASLANLHTSIGKHDIAIQIYKNQLNEAISKGHVGNQISSYNNVGVGYSRIPKNDSALFYYSKALELSDALKNKDEAAVFLNGTIHGNIGSILIKQGKPSEAIPHLEMDFRNSNDYGKFDITVNVGCMLYEAYLQNGQGNKCNEVIRIMTSLKDSISLAMRLDLLAVEVIHYKNSMSSFEYNNLLQEYRDANEEHLQAIEQRGKTIAKVLSSYRAKRLSAKHELENAKTEAQLTLAKQKERNSRLLIILVGSISVLVIVFGLIFFRNRKKQSEIKALLLESEKSKLDSELSLKKMELTDFAINLGRNKDFSEELIQMINEIKSAPGNEISQRVSEISIFVNQHLNTGNTMEVFQQNVDKINKEFFTQLTSLHPQLTQKEKEICGLIRLYLSNKEIASIKNISIQSARTARYRLKKKLEISSDVEIADYLANI